MLDDANAVRPRPFGPRQEQHSDGVVARRRNVEPDFAADGAQMGIRRLNEDACPVAGQRVGAHRAAMGKILENLQALIDDPVALAVPDVRHETDPARVMLVARVVEPLLPGQSLVPVPSGFGHGWPYSP